jgi:L-aminoadipate-semialdehyde dehydrogenase
VRRLQQVERDAEADAVPFETILHTLNKGKDDSVEASRPLFRVRFFDETDNTKEAFIHSTSSTSDLTFFVTRPPTATTHASLAPTISLKIVYNSLLFTSQRIIFLVEQLSVLLRKVSTNPLLPVGSVPLLTPSQRKLLPDATGDLHWCGFEGAIPHIFADNAKQWPDRPCVVQSVPSASPEIPQVTRTFSYGAIRKASNVLAHHLLQGGVQREEVVMVYAHRSVDLLVAVVAILQAGATFSVIGEESVIRHSSLAYRQTVPRSRIPAF